MAVAPDGGRADGAVRRLHVPGRGQAAPGGPGRLLRGAARQRPRLGRDRRQDGAAAAVRGRPGAVLPRQHLQHRGGRPAGRRRDRGRRLHPALRRRDGRRGRAADDRAGAAGRRPGGRGLGGAGGLAARPLSRQRDPRVADAGVRRAAPAQLPGARRDARSGRLRLPAVAAVRRRLPAAGVAGHAPAPGARAGAGGGAGGLAAAGPPVRRLPPDGGRPGAAGRALRRIFLAPRAVGLHAGLRRAGRGGRRL